MKIGINSKSFSITIYNLKGIKMDRFLNVGKLNFTVEHNKRRFNNEALRQSSRYG